MMKPKKGKAAAEDLLRKWQKRLCLQDWHIELVTGCSPDEMMLENCAGCTDWTESAKTARIEILDPQYYGDRIKPFDLEKNAGARIAPPEDDLLVSEHRTGGRPAYAPSH